MVAHPYEASRLMGAVLVDVAEAVKDELALGTHLFAIEPERSYADWDMRLEDLDTVRVDVVPVGVRETRLEARGELVYLCDVDIGVRKRFGADDHDDPTGRIELSEIDDLIQLVEQLHEYMVDADNNGRRLTNYAAAAWQECSIRASYIREHLREMQQFTGILRVTYDAAKAL